MKIAAVDVLCFEAGSATDAALDAVIVRVSTDEGVEGIGEANVPPGIVRAILESRTYNVAWQAALRDILLGQDPEHTERLWDEMYRTTSQSGRRGVVPQVIGAIDVALWDIRGKIAGKPIHHLLGGARKEWVDAYVTIDPDPSAQPAAADDLVAQVVDLGFVAVKLEASLLQAPDEGRVFDMMRGARERLGGGGRLMLDAVYRWFDVKTALRTLDALDELDVFFVESPFSNDDLESYARLAERSRTRVAAGEWAVSRFEFLELMDRGGVDVLQPGIGRVGGFTETLRVARLAIDRGRLVVPYGWWPTALGLVANLHLAAVLENCPMVEYVHPSLYPSPLRDALVGPIPMAVEGRFPLPNEPGLGAALDPDAVKRFLVR